MYSPFISVIVPNFNYEDFVGDCIRSLLEQDYENFEVIVVDDGSTDNSWSVIQGYGDKIKSLRLKNGGALRACLAGTDVCVGEYVYILDSDDRLASPRSLSAIASACAGRPSKVQFPLLPINASGGVSGPAFPTLRTSVTSAEMIDTIMVNGSYKSPPTSGNVYRRDIWEVAREVDYEPWTDGIAYLLAPFRGDVITLGQPLANYRIHGRNDSTSSSSTGRLLREAERFCRRIEHLRSKLPAELAAKLKVGSECFFYNERIVLDHSLNNTLDGMRPVALAFKSLLRSRVANRDKVLLSAWLLALAFAPRRIRHLVGNVRLNPNSLTELLKATGLKRFVWS